MRRSPRVLIAWFAALAVALTTARVVGGDLATLHRRAASLGPERTLVVATHDLALGQTITRLDVRRERRYATAVPREAARRITDVIGHVVIVPILRDAIVFTQHVAPADRARLDRVVPVGHRAVHVVPEDGFRPAPGSIVEVLAAFDPTAVTVDGPAGAAVVVASGAIVLAVDDGSPAGSSDATKQGVTLIVTDTEARSLAFAAATAELTLAVAPPESACCAEPGP